MSAAETWIVVPRWHEFQHYTDRDPLWIKNYRRLLHDPNYMGLTAMQRGILHGIWLMYAASSEALASTRARQVLAPSAYDARRWRDTLDRLNHAGFIELSASRPLAPRYQLAIAEKETEKNYPLTPTSGGMTTGNGTVENEIVACAQCGNPVRRGRVCPSCGASPREAGTSPRAARATRPKKSPLSLAEKMTRNGGWQYEPDAFGEELDRYDLTDDERARLVEIRAECAQRAGDAAADAPAADDNPFFE